MNFPTARYEEYCSVIRLTSKEHEHPVPLIPWGTQRWLRREIIRGLEDDIHEFVILKGVRQAGGSTECWCLASFWCQRFEGTQGAIVTESDENQAYARDVVRDIAFSAPPEYQRPVVLDNPLMLRWANRSRLMFMHASKKAGVKGSLGRSRGLNFLAATEIGSWTDDAGVKSLRSALSKEHPRRVILWESTARDVGVWYDMWRTAEKAVSQRAVFLGWWLREGYEVNPEGDAVQRAAWRAYGSTPPNTEEARLMREVETRFGVTVRQTQLAWWRWQHVESFNGDDVNMNREYGWLPEDCFQSDGQKFIGTAVLRQVRADVEEAPEPGGYRFEWGRTFDEKGDDTIVPVEPEEDAPLTVWEEPFAGRNVAGQPYEFPGVYVVAAHPPYSSSPDESDEVIQVWRAWPDRLVQVAELFQSAEDSATYRCTWSILALCAAYSAAPGPYLIIDISAAGTAVLEEAQQLQAHGWGLSSTFRSANPRVLEFLGNVRHFLYHRPDSFSRTVALQWKQTAGMRPWIMNQLRDSLERGAMIVRSEGLAHELAALRQGGEADDNDAIGGSGAHGSARVMAAALANHQWRSSAVAELAGMLLPREPEKNAPQNATEMVVQGWFGSLLARAGR